MTVAADTIRTERLRLDRVTEEDAGLMLAIWNDPAFIRHVCDRGIRTLEQSLEAMREGALRQWAEFGHGPYRISLRDEGEAIGICGLFRRENLDAPDIGYSLLPPHYGRGYALEAARAVVDHARDVVGLEKIIAIVSPDNPRSIHLLEKLGMRVEGPIRMPGEDEDILLYSLSLN